jgi:hypothetical protein
VVLIRTGTPPMAITTLKRSTCVASVVTEATVPPQFGAYD